jgi:hypothetical protein
MAEPEISIALIAKPAIGQDPGSYILEIQLKLPFISSPVSQMTVFPVVSLKILYA